MKRTRALELADLLRSWMQGGELLPGMRLPAERDFAAALGVARPTLRQALKVLKDQGYVDTRRGAAGGTFVMELAAPAAQWFEEIGGNLDELEDILDFRLAVESQAAAFAARRRTAEDIEALRRAVQLLRQPDLSRAEFRQADSLFHQAIGRASKNRRLEQAIRVSRGEMFLPTERLLYRHHVDVTLKGHKAMLAAIEAADPARATAAAAEHIEVARQEFYDALQRTEPK